MALSRWHIDAGPATREALTRVARRIRLGDDLDGAIAVLASRTRCRGGGSGSAVHHPR